MEAPSLEQNVPTQDPVFVRSTVCVKCSLPMSLIRVYKGKGASEYAHLKGAIVQDCLSCHWVQWHYPPLVYEDAEALVARIHNPALGSSGLLRRVNISPSVFPPPSPSRPRTSGGTQLPPPSQPVFNALGTSSVASIRCSNATCLGQRNGNPKTGNINCIDKFCKACCEIAAARAGRPRCTTASHKLSTLQLAALQSQGPQATPAPVQGPIPQASTVVGTQAFPLVSQPVLTTTPTPLPLLVEAQDADDLTQHPPPATQQTAGLAPSSQLPRQSLARPISNDWLGMRQSAVNAQQNDKTRKVVSQEMADIERRTVQMVVYHTANEPAVISEIPVKTWPRLQIKNLPGVATALNLNEESFVDIYHGGQWKTIHPDAVINLEHGQRIVMRARASFIKGLSDAECPGLEEELAQHHRRHLKRQGSEMVSPLKKTARPHPSLTVPDSGIAISLPMSHTTASESTRAQVVVTNDGVAKTIKQEKKQEPTATRNAASVTSAPLKAAAAHVVIKGTAAQAFKPLRNPSVNLPTYPFGYAFCDYIAGHDEIGRLQLKNVHQRDAFPKVFKGAKYVKSTVSKYRRICKGAPDSIREKYLRLGRTTDALFENFIKELKMLEAGRKPSKEEVESEDSDSDSHLEDELSSGRDESPSPPDEPMPLEVSVENLCPFCDRPLPTPLSPALQLRLEDLIGKSTLDPTEDNPGHRHASVLVFAAFCHEHEVVRNEIPKALEQGWPVDVDFGRLPSRIRDFYEELQEIIEDPDNSDFFAIAKLARLPTASGGAHVGPQGLQVFGRQGAAYYGEQGFMILVETLRSMFPVERFPLEKFAPLTWHSAIEEVLLPEAAVLLIIEDKGVTTVQARQIHLASRRFGLVAHPAPLGEDSTVKTNNTLQAIKAEPEVGVIPPVTLGGSGASSTAVKAEPNDGHLPALSTTRAADHEVIDLTLDSDSE